jgi:uncharacterized membrane protein YdbT with pleckstrin-like domain
MGYLESIMGTEEQIIFSTRRHWLAIGGTVVTSALLSTVIIAAAVILTTTQLGSLALILLLLLTLPIGRLLTAYIDWWNEQFVVTNRRIIQVEGVFNKHVIDSSLDKVNDVVMDQSMMGRLLGYGDIEILTASDIGVNKLKKISHPIRFKTTMLDQKEAMDDQGDHRHDAPEQPTIPQIIAGLADLRDRGIISDTEFQAKKADLMSRL